MFVSKVIECISRKVSPIGNFYKESANGIKVYRYVDNSGKVKLSSFLPDGQPFKTIERENIDSFTISSKKIVGKTLGHNTSVRNHQSGVDTQIRRSKTHYDQFITNNGKDFGIASEYSVRSVKDGNTVGKLIYVEEHPKKGITINADYDMSGNIISRESNEFTIIA